MTEVVAGSLISGYFVNCFLDPEIQPMLGEKVVHASVSKHLSYIWLTSAVLLTSVYFYI